MISGRMKVEKCKKMSNTEDKEMVCMYCSKCGKEVNNEDKFCGKCGKPIKNTKDTNIDTEIIQNNNLNKQVIKLKLWHIVVVVLLCCVLLVSVFLIFNNKNNSEKLPTANDSVVQNKKNIVEIGTYYRYTSDREGEYGSIIFNNDTDFVMKSGVVNSQEIEETGTYQIIDNKITFTMNNEDDIIEDDDESSYTIEMTLLENGNIEYVTQYATCIYVKEGSVTENTIKETTDSADLLDIIYSKYPEFKAKDGFICTDGEEYWLLDNAGKKVYFDSLESFNSALVTINNSKSDKIIDRKEFLEKYVTDDFKQILRKSVLENNILEEPYETNVENFIEDRVEIISEEILYTYIYIYDNGKMKPSLNAIIFVLTPTLKMSNNINIIGENLNEYFVVKRANQVSKMFMDYNGIVTDAQIKDKMNLVNSQLTEEINIIKNYKIRDELMKKFAMRYLGYLSNVPYGYDTDSYSGIAINHDSDSKYKYEEILDSNRILSVWAYKKITKSTSYNISGYTEYMSVGACLTFNKIPLMVEKFTIEELIQTGCVTANSKDCVTTPIKKVMDTDGYSSEDLKQIGIEQDNYIRQYFGL